MPSLLRMIEADCHNRGIHLSKAQSLAKQTIELAAEKVKRMRSMPHDGRDWLDKIAREVLNEEGELEPSSRVVRKQSKDRRAREIFDCLPPSDKRDMLELVLRRGKSVEAAGEQLCLSPEDARALFEKALQLMQDWIDEHGS
jgi:hypothetical protein